MALLVPLHPTQRRNPSKSGHLGGRGGAWNCGPSCGRGSNGPDRNTLSDGKTTGENTCHMTRQRARIPGSDGPAGQLHNPRQHTGCECSCTPRGSCITHDRTRDANAPALPGVPALAGAHVKSQPFTKSLQASGGERFCKHKSRESCGVCTHYGLLPVQVNAAPVVAGVSLERRLRSSVEI